MPVAFAFAVVVVVVPAQRASSACSASSHGPDTSSVVRAGATDGSGLVVDPDRASELSEMASVAAAPPARITAAAAARSRMRMSEPQSRGA